MQSIPRHLWKQNTQHLLCYRSADDVPDHRKSDMKSSIYPRKILQKGIAFAVFLAIILALAKFSVPIPYLDKSLLRLDRQLPLDYG